MTSPDSDSDLSGTTLRETPRSGQGKRQRVPCLTLLCHPDARRIGERAILGGLLLGQAAVVSRQELDFAEPGARTGRPLGDRFVSRTPVRIVAMPSQGKVRIETAADAVKVRGQPLTGHVTVDRASLSEGLPIELADRVLLLLHEVYNEGLHDCEGLLGDSDAIRELVQHIDRVSTQVSPVLLRGESGAGKELAARAIHQRGPRASRRFVAFNMATLTAGTAASDLFGHVKGAFTGAQRPHVGLFERANGGTLFLDEIGETPDEVQPMLLRALETQQIVPVGGSAERKVDVRIVAATDADLEAAVRAGRFRTALYHRLAGSEVRVPALRERPDDVARLALHFVREELALAHREGWLCSEQGQQRIPSALMLRLVTHPWPGNVRQLRNVVRQLVAASDGEPELRVDGSVESLLAAVGMQAPADTPAGPQAAVQEPPEPRRTGPEEIADTVLLAALSEHRWIPARAAKALGVAESTMHDLMARSPNVRRASDIGVDELSAAYRAHGGDTREAASSLRVSERALRMALRKHGLL